MHHSPSIWWRSLNLLAHNPIDTSRTHPFASIPRPLVFVTAWLATPSHPLPVATHSRAQPSPFHHKLACFRLFLSAYVSPDCRMSTWCPGSDISSLYFMFQPYISSIHEEKRDASNVLVREVAIHRIRMVPNLSGSCMWPIMHCELTVAVVVIAITAFDRRRSDTSDRGPR
jgi:hypothetical protein